MQEKQNNFVINEVGRVYKRPWGQYKSLIVSDSYQVKIITVNSQGQLSLQKHFKRSEHLVVVGGVPTITVGENTKQMKVNDSVFIHPETVHRIENFTSEIATIVEIQEGSYLGEDDIVRLHDIYGRVNSHDFSSTSPDK